jgi:hypothetical protein
MRYPAENRYVLGNLTMKNFNEGIFYILLLTQLVQIKYYV